MKRLTLLLFLMTLVASPIYAQTNDNKNENKRFPVAIKAYPFRGMYLDNNTHYEKFGPINPAGVHLGIEFPSLQQRPWQQYLGNPTVGLGISWIDFGDPVDQGQDMAKLGMCVAVYPYILLDAIDTKHFQMRFKVAGGLGIVTQHWYNQADTDPNHYYEPTVNTIFGSPVNAYLNAGINLNLPITRYLAVGGEFGFFHMSSGRIACPNVGMNAIYGSVGLTATLNHDAVREPVRFPDLPFSWCLNITGSAGAHKAAIEDKHRFLISTFHAGAVYYVNNWYGVGPGLDVFYNGAVDNNTGRTLYVKRPEGYSTLDKIRAGISLNNEFRFGRVTALVDWGVYFLNPYRNFYDCDHPIYGYGKRPLFYKNDSPSMDEAFHYIRFGMRYRVWDNIYIQALAKTHLHIVEFIEFGVGYQIPFLRKNHRTSGKTIFHHSRNWWKKGNWE